MKGVKQYLCFEVLAQKSIFIFVDPLSQFNNSRILSTNTTIKTATAQTRVTTKTTSGARTVIMETGKRTVTNTKSAAAKRTTESRATKTAQKASPILKLKVVIVLVVTSIAMVICPILVGYLWWKR